MRNKAMNKFLVFATACTMCVSTGAATTYAQDGVSVQSESVSNSESDKTGTKTSVVETAAETTGVPTTQQVETTAAITSEAESTQPAETTLIPETTETNTEPTQPAETTSVGETTGGESTTNSGEESTTKKSEKETTKESEKETTKKSEKETTKKSEKETTKKSEKETTKKDTSKKEEKKVVKPGVIARLITDTGNEGINIRWSKSSNAKGYFLYRKAIGGSFTLITKTASTGYTDKTVVKGVNYIYSVRAYNVSNKKNYFSEYKTSGTVGIEAEKQYIFNYKEMAAKVPVKVLDGEGYIYPLTSWHPISADFYETVYHTQPHNGTDIAAAKGEYVLAITDGVVEIANYTSARGNQVVLQHTSDSYWSRYQHMDTVYVKAGDKVKKGQIIGTVGSTGNSTGPHLHIELGMNRNYESITSYLDGGSLIDVMLYLPNTKAEVDSQLKGTYVNKNFTKNGNPLSSKKIIANSMKKLKKKSDAKSTAKKKTEAVEMISPLCAYELRIAFIDSVPGLTQEQRELLYEECRNVFLDASNQNLFKRSTNVFENNTITKNSILETTATSLISELCTFKQ